MEAKSPKSTKFWLLIIGAVLVVAVAGLLVIQALREEGAQVVITWNGEVDGTYSLKEDRTFVFEGENGGYNVVTIEDGFVFMEEANCPDQICVKHKPLNQTADPIVCLPNSLVVEVITNETENQLDGVS
ncbi:MAG: NusG domain II-containing protein [Ruminiclostridium sp.]|nr:NusG domain II-containing protein [Ruminiclostridium sp.]MBQ9852336.1 NusG domain II-containing protein [Ruminiclostridium sp.]